jgi:hypothetical protein
MKDKEGWLASLSAQGLNKLTENTFKADALNAEISVILA